MICDIGIVNNNEFLSDIIFYMLIKKLERQIILYDKKKSDLGINKILFFVGLLYLFISGVICILKFGNG